MVKIKIVGATGYGGIGLIELLLGHPEAQIVALVAREDVGKRISDIYPHLDGFCDLPILDAADPRAADAEADIVVFSTPDRVGMFEAGKVLAQGAKALDFSARTRSMPRPSSWARTPMALPNSTARKSSRRPSLVTPVASLAAASWAWPRPQRRNSSTP